MITNFFITILIGMYNISLGLLPVVDELPTSGVGNVLTMFVQAVAYAIQVGYSLPFFRLLMPWIATFVTIELIVITFGASKTAWNFIRGAGA